MVLLAVSWPMSVVADLIVSAIETVSAEGARDKHLFECVGGSAREIAVEG
jgi:hypothetical protein